MHKDHFYRPIHSVRNYRLLIFVLCAAMLLQWPAGAGAANPAGNSPGKLLTLRFAMVHVLGDVNPEDAEIAIKVNWSRHLNNLVQGVTSEFEILSDVQSAADMIAKGRLHGLSMEIAQYLELGKTVKLNPVFISSRLSTPLESYLLLVRKGTSWETLDAQKERRLIIERAPELTIGQMWLETQLHRRNLPPILTYFSQITVSDKPTRIVLPVFFGQADACLVPEAAYQTMSELNPQLQRQLTVLARSPGFIKGIHCTTESMPPHFVDRFIEKGVSMEDSVDGRQLLLIFQMKKNFVFHPEYLANSERIFQAYQSISAAFNQ